MIITKIAEVADMQPGTNLECVRVKILKTFKRKCGDGKYGPWSFQNLKVEDSSGQAEIILSGWDDFGPDTIGQTYAFSANSKGKGLEVVENEYGDKRPRLKIHKSADCALGTGQTETEAEQPQAPKAPPTPPTAQAPKAPAQPAQQPPRPQEPPRAGTPPSNAKNDLYASAPPNSLPLRRRLHRLARLYLHAMNAADYVVKARIAAGGVVQTDDHRHITTTLFIESNRKEWYGLVPDEEPNVAPAIRDVPPPPRQQETGEPDRNYETQHAAGATEDDDVPF